MGLTLRPHWSDNFFSMLTCRTFEPSLFLQHHIKFFFLFDHFEKDSCYRVTPDGCFEINFNLNSAINRKGANGKIFKLEDYYLVSRFSQHYFLSYSGYIRMLGIRFYPWGLRPFVKLPLSEITDMNLSQEEIFGSKIKILQEKVINARTVTEAIRFIENYFAKELYNACFNDIIVADATKNILASRGSIKMDYLLSSYNLTVRRMEKKFNNTIGLSAKMYSRLIKFLYALSMLKTDSLTRIAYKANYFDQPHFIREFKYFSGVTPGKYISERNSVNELIFRNSLAIPTGPRMRIEKNSPSNSVSL